MEKPVEKTKREVKRSPGYPVIALQEAIEKTRLLWNKDKTNNVPIEAAYNHLGYKSIGGHSARIMAALKKFNLIFETKTGIKLTDEAVDLMIHDPSDEHYISTLRKLATKPNIYERILNDFNGVIPSDATLRVKLIKEYSFNVESVDDFINNFRNTIEFAGLTEGNALQKVQNASEEEAKPIVGVPLMPTPENPKIEKSPPLPGLVFPIPLSKRKQAAIAFESLPVEKKDIAAIKAWLELFSDSLTEEEEG
jgi:hypothetical protein